MPAAGDITRWLQRLQEGDDDALEALMPLLYDELRVLARKHLRNERPGHTLNPTALVNEVYLKLVHQQRLDASNRAQFFGIAGRTMRRLLRDYARTKKRIKRGGGQRPLPLDDVAPFLSDEEADEVLALDEALDRLAEIDPRASQVVQ
ncbi:MAG: RNA polymerase subunit sigma-70 [Bacteroidetes bacterium]|nr:RNA polymerase subunit sigma-70 [Bacteroidota bacterium]